MAAGAEEAEAAAAALLLRAVRVTKGAPLAPRTAAVAVPRVLLSPESTGPSSSLAASAAAAAGAATVAVAVAAAAAGAVAVTLPPLR